MTGFYSRLIRCASPLIKQSLKNLSQPTGIHHIRSISCLNGDLKNLPQHVQEYVQKNIKICEPKDIYICDGSQAEEDRLLQWLERDGVIRKFTNPKYENNWLCLTDPADVARVESKTLISTPKKEDTIPTPKEGVKGVLGYWKSPEELNNMLNERFPGCMKGRTMYVLPFSMGPVGSHLSKIGIQCTDSAFVVRNMMIMTRVGDAVVKALGKDGEFIKCLHSVGQPLPMAKPPVNNWPCNPEKTVISHIPANNEICSFGSGYGGNSLLGKKCFALRLGSIIAKREGWLAEHMLILGITNPQGVKKYIAAAFPSACGKTNLAMMNPTIPGYKVECVGDDIAWMRFDKDGRLRAINPESGFFGVAPGTSHSTNPNAMKCIEKNTIFTNTAMTSDGGFFWEGLEKEVSKDATITSWLGQENWTKESGKLSSHPNSRFCTPARQCPIMDPAWEDPAGVPIDAILFGGRRPEGVPLIYESFSWSHGVLIGGGMRSEATFAAEHKGKAIMHDPFAMRPFFGYNFGQYMQHWLDFEKKPGLKLPKIFHVNWFRKNKDGKFIWPGFGENSRALDYILRRLDGADIADKTPIGYVPKVDAIKMDGYDGKVDMKELLTVPKDFWINECKEVRKYFDEQLPHDLPAKVKQELDELEKRVHES